MVPELTQPPASGGNPVGPDSDCGVGGVVEIGPDSFIGKERIRGAAQAEDVFGVYAEIRSRNDALAQKIQIAGDKVMVPELTLPPASGGNPVGPDSDCGVGGVVEIGSDSYYTAN